MVENEVREHLEIINKLNVTKSKLIASIESDRLLVKANVSLENLEIYNNNFINEIRYEVGLETKDIDDNITLEKLLQEKIMLFKIIVTKETIFRRKFLNKLACVFKRTGNVFRSLENKYKKMELYFDEIISDNYEEFDSSNMDDLKYALTLDYKIFGDKVTVDKIISINKVICNPKKYGHEEFKIKNASLLRLDIKDNIKDGDYKKYITNIRKEYNIPKEIDFNIACIKSNPTHEQVIYTTTMTKGLNKFIHTIYRPDIVTGTFFRDVKNIKVPSRKELRKLLDNIKYYIDNMSDNVKYINYAFEKIKKDFSELDDKLMDKYDVGFIDYPIDVRIGFNLSIDEINAFYNIVTNFGDSYELRLRKISVFLENSILRYER